jgi:hypothetical protein
MSHQFDLFPPTPRKERSVNGLTLFCPWTGHIVIYELNALGLRAARVLGPCKLERSALQAQSDS